MIQVAAAIIKNPSEEFLICQRKDGGSCSYLWEFPGGKREKGETIEECLIRECREELGVGIEVGELFAKRTYRYPEREIAFSFFEAVIVDGTPQKEVHHEIRWVKAKKLAQYDFCPADIEIIAKLSSLYH